jgi:hypothetical protein
MNYEYKINKASAFPGIGGNLFTNLLVEYAGIEYSMVAEKTGNRVLLSDEPYWNPAAAYGDMFSTLVDVANYHGFLGGVCITPISWDYFGGTATAEELIDLASRADFVVIDPYLLANFLTAEQLLWFSEAAIRVVHGMGKEITVVVQGFAEPGMEDEVYAYNALLTQLPFNEVVYFDAYDFWDIPDEWQLELIGVPTCPEAY